MSSSGIRQSSPGRQTSRTKVVWAVFATLMTGMSGILLLSDTPPATHGTYVAATPSIMPLVMTSENSESTADDQSEHFGRWTSIVIHHSGRMTGTVRDLDSRALDAGLNGLGYHFVIGNGSGLSDGVVEAGYRWNEQAPGAHVAVSSSPSSEERALADELNRYSIGICLVGNGDRQPFTEAQVRSLIDLIDSLQKQCDIPAVNVFLHSDVSQVENCGPGRFFPTERIEARLAP